MIDVVNPVPVARAAWPTAAGRAGATVVLLETSVPDQGEHRRRVGTRVPDLPAACAEAAS